MSKDVYAMIDGKPVWQHLKEGSKNGNIKLVAYDYGRLAEMIGQRVLYKLTDIGGLDKFFPDVNILSAKKVIEGDYALEVAFQNGSKYGKNIIIFEIKHGKTQIRQQQLQRYCSMIIDPNKFFKKVDEIKIFFMLIDNIDTLRNFASYRMKELDKDLARKILTNIPVTEEESNKDYEKWKEGYNGNDTANLISALYGDVEI